MHDLQGNVVVSASTGIRTYHSVGLGQGQGRHSVVAYHPVKDSGCTEDRDCLLISFCE